MSYPLPTIPNDTALLKVYYLKPANDSYMIGSYNFIATSTPTTFNMVQALQTDIASWAITALSHTTSNDTPLFFAWFFYRYGGVTHSMQPPFGILGWNAVPYIGPSIASTINACFRRETGFHGRQNLGRVYGGALPRDYVDGNYLSSLGLSTLTLRANHMTDPWVSQGVTFVPALWSRQLGICTPLSNVKVLLKISRVYKRRMIAPYTRAPIVWPIVP